MLPATAIAQTSGTWTNTAGGAWGTGTNWSGGIIADGTGAVADFSTLDITGVKTITLDAPRTSGTLLFGDTAGANGGWTLTSSTLTLATVSGAPTISVTGMGNSASYGTNAVTIQSVIAGTSGLTKTGTSALVLSAANTYAGTTNINAGYLVLNNASALGSSSVAVAAGASLAIGNGITISGKSITVGSNGVGNDGTLTAISGGTGTWAGNVTLSGGRIGYNNGSNLVITGTIGGSNNLIISAYSPSDGPNTQTTAYAVTIAAPATYTGQTQLLRGNLRLGVDNALPTGTTLDIHYNTANTATQTSTVDLNGFSQTVGALQSSGVLGGYANAYLQNSGTVTKTFTVNQATNTTFYGIIQGNLAFTKSGTGNLTLTPTWLTGSGTNWVTGTSTFSGDTLVSAGTLTLGNANALFGSTFDTASTGTLSLGTLTAATFGGLKNSGTFTLTNSGSAFALSVGGNNASSTFAGTLNGLGGLTKVGSGTFTVTGSSGYAGVTTLAGGAFALGGANAVPASGTITFSGGALQYTASNTTDYTARIANSGSAVAIDTNGQSVTFTGGINATNTGGLTKLGSGTLTLSGSSGYSGATTVASGVLALGNANSLPASGTVTFTGGTLQYSGSNTADLASRIASSTAAIAIDTNGQSVTWAGNLASTNTGGLTKTGSGLLTLSGSNAFTGAVAVTGGTLAVSGSYAFPTGVTGVSLNGGALQATGSVALNSPGGILSSATISLGASGGTLASGLSAQTQWYINAPITGGAGTGALSVSGTGGEFVLTGSSSYTGGTILSAAQVAIGSDAAFGTGTITFTGGGLRATGAGVRTLSNAVAISAGATFYGSGNNPDVVFTGPITLTGSTQTVTTTLSSGANWNGLVQFNGSVGDGGNAYGLTKAGAGILVLGGSNTYSGTTTLAAGTLRLAHTNALAGGGNLSFTGGALQYSGSNQVDYSARIVSSTSAIAIDTNGQSLSFASTLAASNVAGLTKLGSGTLTLSTSNAFTGPVTLGGGMLAVANANGLPSSGTVTFSGGTLQYSASYKPDLSGRIASSSGAIAIDTNSQSVTFASSLAASNAGGLTKSGAGALTLSASNAYSGATTVDVGGLALNHPSALGASTVITVNGLAAMTLNNGITVGQGKTVTVNSSAGSGGLQGTSGTGTWAGTVIMGGAGRLGYDLSGSLVVTGSVGGAGLIISGMGGDTNTSVAGYSVTLAGPTGYTGSTQIIRGWLKIGADNTLPAGTTLDVYTIGNNFNAAQAATFDLNGFNQTVAGLTSSGNNGKTGYANGYVTNTGASVKTLTVNQATSGTYGGLITGNLAFTKTGSGNLTLMPIFVTTPGSSAYVNGTNTFTGDTLVSAGTLTLSSATTSTSLALAGSTFDSSGAGSLSFGSMTAATFGGVKGSGNLALQNDSSQAVALTVGSNNGSTTFSGNLTGVGSLVKSGTGTLTLSGSNGYTGSTTIGAGVLALGGVNALAGTGTVAFTGGTLQYGAGVSTDVSGLIRGSSSAIQVDTNGQDVTFANAINSTNAAGLVKNGTGTLTLSGSNTYGGNTTVNAGTLAFTNGAVWTGLSGTVALNGATLAYTGTSAVNQTLSLPIQLGGSGGTLTNPGAAYWYLSGQISGTGALTVASGSTLMVLQGPNTNSGGVTLQAGSQVVVGNDSAGPAGSPTSGAFGTGVLTLAGGSLRSTTGAARTIANAVSATADTSFSSAGLNDDKSLTFTGPVTLSGGSRTLTVDTTGTGSPAVIFSGAIGDGGNGYGLTKSGVGTLTLSGSNTYTGATSITAGTLQFGNVSAFAGTSGISVGGGASLAYTGGAASLARGITVTGGTGTVRNAGSGQLTLAGTLTKNGTVLRLTGGAFNVTGQIVGASANSDLLVDGTSTVTLSNTNTYNGPTFVNQSSTLVVGVSNAIPSNSTVTLGNATTRGTLDLGSNTDAIGGIVFSGSGGTLRMAANQTASPQLATTGSLGLGANASLDLTGMSTTAGRYQLVSYTASSGSFGGVTGLASGYQLVYGATRLDAQQKAVVGTVTVTSPTAAIITGGSAAFTYTVANAAASGGADLVFASSAGANLAGLSSGTVAAGSTSGPISGLFFNGTAIGLAQTGTFTVADPAAYGGSQTGVVTATVLDHATPGFVGIDAALTNLVLDFGTVDQSAGLQGKSYALTNIASVYGDTLTAGLALTGFSHLSGDTLFDTGLATFASLLAGGTNGYLATFTPASQGTFSEVFKLTFSDQQNVSGAAQRRDLTLTMNVIVVPEPGAIALAGVGIALACWTLRGRRRK